MDGFGAEGVEVLWKLRETSFACKFLGYAGGKANCGKLAEVAFSPGIGYAGLARFPFQGYFEGQFTLVGTARDQSLWRGFTVVSKGRCRSRCIIVVVYAEYISGRRNRRINNILLLSDA